MNRTRFCLVLAMLALPGLAGADGAPDKPTLTRAQIEQCLLDRRDVVAQNQALTATKLQLDARSAELLQADSQLQRTHEALQSEHHQLQAQDDELKRHGDDLPGYIALVGPVKKASDAYLAHVARYNEQVRAHRQSLDQYNAEVTALNAKLEPLDRKAKDTDRRCVAATVERGDLKAAKAAVGENPETKMTPEVRVLP